ncbi:hypothetical protein HDU79_006949 [Rhizoclosmatium sp. JEL0117]|nr:hypothetical protein HDU79_006949 [Rhizoclosmatium sp. JEL0117]
MEMEVTIASDIAATRDETNARVFNAIRSTGLANSAFADISVRILGIEHKLHRVLLYSNRFFRATLDQNIALGAGLSAQKYSKAIRKQGTSDPFARDHSIDIDVIKGVTREGVNIILERIYGKFGHRVTDDTFTTLLPAAYFFSDEELCDQCSIYIQTLAFTPANILPFFFFASTHDFGPYSELLLRNCLIYLCKEGAYNPQLGPSIYSQLDYDWLATIVCSDVFFVKSEAERYAFLTSAIKARDGGAETLKIRDFLSGVTRNSHSRDQVNFTESISSTGTKLVVQDTDSQVPKDEDDYLNQEMLVDGDLSDLESPPTSPRAAAPEPTKRIGILADIDEEEDEPAPIPPPTLVSPPTSPLYPPRPSSATNFNRQTQIHVPIRPSPLGAPKKAAPSIPQSFYERRAASTFLVSPDINSVPNAIDLISNGIIYTHIPPSTLSVLNSEGLISPLTLSLHHKSALHLHFLVKKAPLKSPSLGLKYTNDRLGISQKILSSLDPSVPEPPAAFLPPPSFYDWIFNPPFRHNLSEVQPLRISLEFPLQKIATSRLKQYSNPVAYAGSLWYIMLRNDSTKQTPRISLYLYRKQDKKISGYTDTRPVVQVWSKACLYIHVARQASTVVVEPYAFETMIAVPLNQDAKFVGDANRVSGEELMGEVKGLQEASGIIEGSTVRCAVLISLF